MPSKPKGQFGTSRYVYPSRRVRRGMNLLAVLALALAGVSAWLAWHGSTWSRAVVAVCWTLVPPAWFLFEYYVIFPRWGDESRLGEFKYGQSLSAKFWAGVLVLLAAIYTQDSWLVGPGVPCP